MATRINVPPITRGLMLGLFILTLLNASFYYRVIGGLQPYVGSHQDYYYAPYLTIVPGSSIFYPWVFVSATLAEQNPVGLIITGATLFYGGRYLERAWSSQEYAKFMLLIALVPNVLSFFIYLFGFGLTRNMDMLTTSISGGLAIQAAFLVSFKQLVPEHTVTVLRGLIRMRVKHFPAIFLLANTISGIAFGTDTALFLSWLGFLTSWVYLRFYRISPSLISSATTTTSTSSDAASGPTIRGDASDTFAFECFFPDAIQPAISAVTTPLYNLLVTLKICTPFSAADIDASNEQASVRSDGELPSLLYPGRGSGRREEAERRRALALRALDQRLYSNSARGAPRPPPSQPPQPPPQPQSPAPDMLEQQRHASPAPAPAPAPAPSPSPAAADQKPTEAVQPSEPPSAAPAPGPGVDDQENGTTNAEKADVQ